MTDMCFLPPPDPIIVGERDYIIDLPSDEPSLIPGVNAPPIPESIDTMPCNRAYILCNIADGEAQRLRRIRKQIRGITTIDWADEEIQKEIQKMIDATEDEIKKEKLKKQGETIIEKKNSLPQKNYIHIMELVEPLSEEDMADGEIACEFVGIEIDPPLTPSEIEDLLANAGYWWI